MNLSIHQEIYVMNADGTNQRRLTNDDPSVNITRDDYRPKWSPDGTRIAFGRRTIIGENFGEQNEEIYVMNADGSGQRNLTNNPTYDRFPSWSPDGTQIAFESRRGRSRGIYVMDADGSNVRILTTILDSSEPVWRPVIE